MNPNQDFDNQPPNTDEKMDQWFHNLDSPALEQHHHTKRYLFVSIIGFLVVAITSLAVFLFSANGMTPLALTCSYKDTYKELIELISAVNTDETQANSIAKDKVAYVHHIYFTDKSLAYNSVINTDPTDLMNALGANYRKHSSDAPFAISLSGTYLDNDTIGLTGKRLEKIRGSLVKAGVDPSSITVQKPDLLLLNGDSLADDSEEATAIVMSISPTKSCSEITTD